VVSFQFYPSRSGISDLEVAEPFVWRITVRPDGPAYRAGLRTGDVIDARAMTAVYRYRLFEGSWWHGERAVILASRNGKPISATITAESTSVPWRFVLLSVGRLVTLIFATMLALRRSNSVEGRIIAVMLAADVIIANSGAFRSPSAALDACIDAAGLGLLPLFSALPVAYAALFGRPLSPLRRGVTLAAYGFAALSTPWYAASILGAYAGAIDPLTTVYAYAPRSIATAIAFAFALAGAVLAVRNATPAERVRLSFALVAFGGIYLHYFAWFLLPPSLSGDLSQQIFSVSVLLGALLMAYLMLNRRLVDVGFALNRAVVFSVVSLILVSAFVLVEWLLADFLRDASHTTNTIVTAAVVLVLGVSMRFVHHRIDRVVDAVFFRKRHESEHAIRTCAEEARYVTDRTVLLERAVRVLEEHTDATSVVIALRGADRTYAGVDENDPVVLRLQATHHSLDMHGFETAFAGDYAYPMVVRGRLTGVLLLGERRSGELFAPDESAAIAHLAHSVAVALDGLDREAGRDATFERIENVVTELTGVVKALGTKLDATTVSSPLSRRQ
jgi:hypothetical protein